ncbi:MAG: 8-amino-3,8-dideoxy-manno-octulosonate cytidylyltransferase [Chlamydiia bacterium]|nr:8-amino-3,8-dideoxy-manno-octulosonate cytidylyltransferase [Chlamydiia bacterium]
MYKNKKIICVIPARLSSTRFKEKVLAPIDGKPLFYWTYQAAKKCPCFDEILLACDDERVKQAADQLNVKSVMTPVDCPSGTDRLIAVKKACKAEYDIWLNWQADEPLITFSLIEDLLINVQSDEVDLWTLKQPGLHPEKSRCQNIVKVKTAGCGRAMDFSREPFCDLDTQEKHIGIYAFTAKGLDQIERLSVTDREKKERLEQLRFLEAGMHIQVNPTEHETIGVDTYEEFLAVQKKLSPKKPSPAPQIKT